MKIAIPTKDQMVDNHFGNMQYYTIYTIDNQKKIISKENLPCPEGCGCKTNISTTLHAMGVEIILAGNMGIMPKTYLKPVKLELFEVVKAY